jgi:hypothetical protein
MDNAQFQRIESWLALIAEELYVARLDREAVPRDAEVENRKRPDASRRDSHLEQILKLRKSLSE